MTEPSRESTDEVLAMLALLGQTGVVHGAPPTQLELANLARGALSASRLAEVESHIAHDPHVFRDFLSAGKAGVYDRTLSPPWLTRLAPRWSLAAVAACAVVAIGFVLAINVEQQAVPPDSPRLTTDRARSLTPRVAAIDWRRRAVRYGYENPSALKRLIGPSGDALSAECTGEACGNEIDALTEFGAALARLNSACQARRSAEETLAAAPYEVQRLQAMRSQMNDAHWRRQVDGALAALDRPAPQACAGVGRIGRSAGVMKN